MKKEYKSRGGHNYLVIPLEKEHKMEQNMLLHNEIKGILPCEIKEFDEQRVIEFEIDGRSSLESYFEQRQLDSEDIFWIINGVLLCLQSVSKFLLRTEGVVLDKETIFFQERKKCIELCYIPAYGEDTMKRLEELTEELMKVFNHKEEEGVHFLYGFYQLLQEPNISLFILEDYRKKEEKRRQGLKEKVVMEKKWALEETSIPKIQGMEGEKKNKKSFYELEELHPKEVDVKAAYPKENYYNLKVRESQENDYERKQNEGRNKKRKREEKQEKRGFQTQDKKEENKIESKELIHWGVQIVSTGVGIVFLLLSLLFLVRGQWKNGVIGLAFFLVDCYMIFERQCGYNKKKEKRVRLEEGEILNKKRFSFHESNKKSRRRRKKVLEEEQTVLLSKKEEIREKSSERKVPYLKGVNSNAHLIPIYQTPMVLGSLEEAVDGVLFGKGISRIHAIIEAEGFQYYIRDLDSTNGTYWNGEKLSPQIPKEIQEGDKIIIGDQIYEFLMMESV